MATDRLRRRRFSKFCTPRGLLDGLDGQARTERAELIAWLLQRGVTSEQIRAAVAPMLLVSRRLIGDDGSYVSARESSDKIGIDVDLLQRLQHAMGLASVDDPDAAVHLRADAEGIKDDVKLYRTRRAT